jgi:hypothetical protein
LTSLLAGTPTRERMLELRAGAASPSRERPRHAPPLPMIDEPETVVEDPPVIENRATEAAALAPGE